jgi:hypothetical protein
VTLRTSCAAASWLAIDVGRSVITP